MDRTHIFLDQTFWHHFQKQMHAKSWKCEFSTDVLVDNLFLDAKLYKDDTIFRQRRERIIPWIHNDHQWNRTLLGACKELAIQRPSIHSQVLKNLHVFDALKDFVDHLYYFYMIASTMSDQGHPFQPISQYSSKIHDLDKLDPIMLLGYSERFEDNVSTSVWDLCVERHIHVNPHHQVHTMWHNLSEEDTSWRHCCEEDTAWRHCSEGIALEHSSKEDIVWTHCSKEDTAWTHCSEVGTAWRLCSEEALREMVCDKVSRRLQKNLNGAMSDDMWDVDVVYFEGLPDQWMVKATNMMKVLKQSGVSVVL